jgi:CMP-N,N'-diacetyllegionaminic acid synthase
MKIICTICARGGSKGLKSKNIRELDGIPLIAHTIKQAQSANIFDVISVSSDSIEILNVAKSYEVNHLIKRPQELATDKASKLLSIIHCFQATEKITCQRYDVIVDLDVTSPLRTTDDINNAIDLLQEAKVSNVLTGIPARRSPYFNMVELDENGIASLPKKPENNFFRRQDSPLCYDLNAAIYVWKRDCLLQNSDSVWNEGTRLYVMSEDSMDIDSELDFEMVEFLMKRKKLY